MHESETDWGRKKLFDSISASIGKIAIVDYKAMQKQIIEIDNHVNHANTIIVW